MSLRMLAANIIGGALITTALLGAATANAETTSQHNATRAAETYLKVLPMSHDGLITQLEYDQYSPADADYAVDRINPDWNAVAAAKARLYLRTMPFSKARLIAQLEYDKFTPAQAQYGADTAYEN